MDGEQLVGVLTEKSLLHRAINGGLNVSIRELCDLDFCVVHDDTELPVLLELFSRFKVALVFDDKKGPKGIITRIDLIDYMSASEKK